MGCSLWAGHTSNLGFPCGSVSKEFLARQETWVQSLGQEDPLEKETHCSILAWEIPRTEKLGGLQHNLASKPPALLIYAGAFLLDSDFGRCSHRPVSLILTWPGEEEVAYQIICELSMFDSSLPFILHGSTILPRILSFLPFLPY